MKANAVFNGTTGLTTIFSVVLNIRDVLDMALNRTIEFILFVFILWCCAKRQGEMTSAGLIA